MLKQGANNNDTRVKMFKGENPEKNSTQLSSMKHERTWELFFKVGVHWSSQLNLLTHLLKTYNYNK